jgi:hypothetical protein
VATEWPAATAVLTPSAAPAAAPAAAAAPPVAAPPVAASGRPRWLIPAIAASAFAVLVVVAGVIVFLTTRSTSPSFTEQANSAMVPVLAADNTLSDRLAAVQKTADLAAVTRAAAASADALTTARGAIGVIASGKNAQPGKVLQDAVSADLAYANAVKAAAAGLTTGLASAAETAGQQAGQAYQSAAAASPTLIVPAARLYLTAQQLSTRADAQQKAAQQKASDVGALRTYVRSIDSLLRNSADTRSNLGTLISQVQSGQLGGSEASATIASIINQRQDLQNQVSAVPAPPPFRAVADRLRQSITAALQDDYAIQSWINAWYANDSYAFNQAYSQHTTATAQATQAKASFLDLYNRLRARYLHLPPIDITY